MWVAAAAAATAVAVATKAATPLAQVCSTPHHSPNSTGAGTATERKDNCAYSPPCNDSGTAANHTDKSDHSPPYKDHGTASDSKYNCTNTTMKHSPGITPPQTSCHIPRTSSGTSTHMQNNSTQTRTDHTPPSILKTRPRSKQAGTVRFTLQTKESLEDCPETAPPADTTHHSQWQHTTMSNEQLHLALHYAIQPPTRQFEQT